MIGELTRWIDSKLDAVNAAPTDPTNPWGNSSAGEVLKISRAEVTPPSLASGEPVPAITATHRAYPLAR